VTPELVLVVPCYNEAARLDPEAFLHCVSTHPGMQLVLVNDGSVDGTAKILDRIRGAAPASVTIVREPINRGKAEAVRAGMLAALSRHPRVIAFFDADLSTPLQAVDDFLAVLRTRPAVELVLGSRVMLMGRDIRRRPSRHYLGRVFATAVSHALDLPVYDTQCGAKMFRVSPELGSVLAEPFRTTWVFDVELLARFVRMRAHGNGPAAHGAIYEMPLMRWADVAGSKLRPRDYVTAVRDLWRIHRAYFGGTTREAATRPPVED
jgi:glycosyltransferase involved in cell wall biosynthesis